ncbi:DCN1-like protein 2-like protein [Corchorus olitorius]|uniref:DCN1-like protein 2-like protein n=1 Tax=Corchorus olitorius TaxID=93759 RepID=A0A1R3KPH5_9ROSI|nr:DCN1-like protein 2-like protein [Corchorus olitorius]
MHKLGRGHRDKVQQFMTITGARRCSVLTFVILGDHCILLYPYSDMILADGITLLCNDLQVDPQDIVTALG